MEENGKKSMIFGWERDGTRDRCARNVNENKNRFFFASETRKTEKLRRIKPRRSRNVHLFMHAMLIGALCSVLSSQFRSSFFISVHVHAYPFDIGECNPSVCSSLCAGYVENTALNVRTTSETQQNWKEIKRMYTLFIYAPVANTHAHRQ